VSPVNRPGATGDRQGAATDRKGAAADHPDAIANHQLPLILQCRGQKRLSLRDMLIMEAIDLNVWIFTAAARWVPTIMIYGNDLEYGWS
jgi:hypothetical protein